MTKAKVAILISGRGSNMMALLYASRLPDSPYEVVLVASNDPEAPGLPLAAAEGVPTFAHSHKGLDRVSFDAIMDAQLRAVGADYVALAGYMRILSTEFVASWEGRMLNIHPSLLPKYKGLDTHGRSIVAGDSHAGCSVHLVTAELDDGPVLGQVPVKIVPGETPDSLASRVVFAEHQLYPKVLADFVRRDTHPEWLLSKVREFALALPETEEKASHGSPGFFVSGGKFFAYFSYNHHHDGVTGLLVKTSGVEEQAMLIDRDPDLYYRPAYLGPSGWIGIRLDRGGNDWEHIADWLQKSWRLSAPKRLTKMMNIADAF
ncbi:phosphoribosylglycinamide formyltransferase [Sphingobium sp. SCG-1]|uniref:phosphoribosylglycinamide formyltransferase n=1 Tax=Sphingobium sp. SCG-1 TaxID=2072936 RepID=UPI000CD6798C|nr:phosphoribosylglycinamide formyltransferase [Sphingobium sp. SCG-1]AUW58868.1 phosphoribosylglycinamide formyltransferase [Sphingobium sp. SCG-1]